MKIVMTLLVRDEEDIVRQNIDFHLNQGVDFIIATDNLSVDSTSDILKEYEAKRKLRYIFEPKDDYNQHEWVTRMARLAASKYGADWVINNDADEFWWPSKGTLREALLPLAKSINIIKAERKEFVYLGEHEDSQPFYETMIYKEIRSFDVMGKPIRGKVAHRGSKDIVVEQGNHAVSGFEEENVADCGIEIFHFPLRTKKQFLNKIKKGGAAYGNNKELPCVMGDTWRKLYQSYAESGSLNKFIGSQSFDEERIAKGMLDGSILQDDRLMKYLRNLYANLARRTVS